MGGVLRLDALERAKASAEIGQLILGKSLAPKHQYRVTRPQGAKLVDGPIVYRLPELQPDDLASKAVIRELGFHGN